MADGTTPRPRTGDAQTMRLETLREILDVLSFRERRVLELRYGLTATSRARSTRSARAFHVTRERIRQIENQALKKLSSLSEAQRLRELV